MLQKVTTELTGHTKVATNVTCIVLKAASENDILNSNDGRLIILTSDEVSINHTVHHVYLTACTHSIITITIVKVKKVKDRI